MVQHFMNNCIGLFSMNKFARQLPGIEPEMIDLQVAADQLSHKGY
jgi:hypothetical protein